MYKNHQYAEMRKECDNRLPVVNVESLLGIQQICNFCGYEVSYLFTKSTTEIFKVQGTWYYPNTLLTLVDSKLIDSPTERASWAAL